MVEPPNYSQGINFKTLASQNEDFGRKLAKWGGRMEFKDPESLISLTKALLSRDFHRNLELPTNRLCPPVPQRYAYIQWIQSLIDSTSPSYRDAYDPERTVTGIDIGIGASCIYSLLGTAVRSNWSFHGTEIDSESYTYASRNVELNGLDSRIQLHLLNPNIQGLIPLDDMLGVDGKADFVMCNPPFFSSDEDMMATWTNKAEPPSAICTGAPVEMICPGGDLGFAKRIVDESMQYKRRIQWFTCMLGKLFSATELVSHLKSLNCGNWAVGTLLAGSKTRRWVVGWSWHGLRPRNEVAKGVISQRSMLPPPTEIAFHAQSFSISEISSAINKAISTLHLQWNWDDRERHGILKANKNVWSRFARREALRKHQHGTQETDSNETVALIVRVTIIPNAEVNTRWIFGYDFILFESFCGWLRRQPPFGRQAKSGAIAESLTKG